MSRGFDYFRLPEEHEYSPVTARSALRALENALVRPEAYVFLATSVSPVDEEPVDLEEIQRILSRKDHDLETNLLLLRVLRRLLRRSDPEVALFAAEGINRIESRYTERIQALKKLWREERDREALRGLAAAYYELSCASPGAVGSFYLREAFRAVKVLQAASGLREEELHLLVRVLLALELPQQALAVLKRLKGRQEPPLLLLEAEVQFRLRNFTRVRELCGLLEPHRETLQPEEQGLLDAWGEL